MVQFTKKEEVVKVVTPTTYTLELNEKEFAVIAGLVGAVSCGGEVRATISELWANGGMREFFITHGMKVLFPTISLDRNEFPEDYFKDKDNG